MEKIDQEKLDALFSGGEAETTIERTTKNIIQIRAKTVTPLLQIGSSGGQRVKYTYEEGRSGSIPFFSSNGIRGILRRIMTGQQIKKAKEIDGAFSISPDLFYLYAQGAALDKISMKGYIPYANETEVRLNSPILSLFGAGLSGIEGKLAVADLEPARDIELFGIGSGKDDREYTYSLLMQTINNYRTDAIVGSDFLRSSLSLDYESIKEWSANYSERVRAAQKAKGKGEKEKISHISMPQDIPVIIPGVPMRTSIGSKYGFSLTEVEVGAIVSALRELSVMQIGSMKRIGFGVLDWEVLIDGVPLIRTSSNPDFVLDREINISSLGKEKIAAWEEWLDENANKMEEAVIPSIE